MTYQIDVNGRVRRVTVHRRDQGFLVDVDGASWRVDAVRIDPRTLSILMASPDVEAGGRSHDVTIVPSGPTGQWSIQVGAMPLAVTMNGLRPRRRGGDAGHVGDGPFRITAPMPGRVVRLMVQLGDRVQARQPIVIIEAMKMENELRAARDGVVTELPVQPGQSVDAGALLAVIEAG